MAKKYVDPFPHKNIRHPQELEIRLRRVVDNDNDLSERLEVVTNALLGVGFSETILAAVLATNVDPTKGVIVRGKWRLMYYFASHNANTWETNGPSYTVPSGKTLYVIGLGPQSQLDDVNRGARLRNVTALSDLISSTDFNRFVGFPAVLWQGDGATPSSFLVTASAGQTVQLQLWNADTSKRAIGASVILYEQ